MNMRGRDSARMRARRRWWSDAARQARADMRARGLMVDPWVDDVAGQRRGKNVADQLGRLADEMRGAGLTEDQIRRTIVAAVVAIVETQDGPERAA